MARPLRIEFPGAIYHVTSRGDRREPIFDDDEERLAFLAVIAQATERFDAAILAYCLMDNHFHLVIHSHRHRHRHRKVGHLFQGRFKGILVDENAYLLEVCSYVDLNPARALMVRDPGNWRWSSYRAHTGNAPPPTWLDTDAVRDYATPR